MLAALAHENPSQATWRALADPTRRRLLELLSERPRTTGELCEAIPNLTRTGVLQHLAILDEANLVIATKEGRRRWNHINALEIHCACGPWIERHVAPLARAMLDLKRVAEASPATGDIAMPESATDLPLRLCVVEFTIDIAAPREQVWRALIDETASWWPRDFYVSPTPKGVHIEPRVGGRWYEDAGDGAGGLWGLVQTVLPPEKLEITGDLFPAWGGPARMHLTLTLEATGDGSSRLTVHDALFGAVAAETEACVEDGWRGMFERGLKPFVEKRPA